MSKKPYYKGLIFREFYFHGTLSCAELSTKISKSFPLTMKVLNELIDEGYIKEDGCGPSSGGRRPLKYSIVPDSFYILSVAMDQLVTRISIMDVNNKHVRPVQKFDLPLENNPYALNVLCGRMDEVITNSGVPRSKIIGAGIGMPGFVDFKNGINHSYLQSKGMAVTDWLSAELGMPVYIDNDSSLIALAEYRFGATSHQQNVMVINVGWGVGLGMILNGELFRGQDGFAGEFSHMSLFKNNKLCACGKMGCLETEASLGVMIEKVIEGLKAGRESGIGKNFATGQFERDWETIAREAVNNDPFIIELLSETAYNIGKGIAILIHLINPETVILSGRGALAGKVWLAPIQQALNQHAIPRLRANTSIAVSTLGYQAELIGSAALVMQHQAKKTHKSENQIEANLSL